MPVIEVEGIKTFFSCHLPDSNNTYPVILVHGAGGDHMTWPASLRRLKGAVVYAIDLPGHGETGGKAFNSIERYAGFVKSFIDAVDISKAVLIGHSMGGAVVLTLAVNYPDVVDKLVISGAGVRFRVLPAFLEGLSKDPEKTLIRFNDYAYGKNVSEKLVNAGKERIRSINPETMRNDLLAADKFDLTERAGEIKKRALIISGEKDLMQPYKFGAFLCHQIKKSRLKIIKDAGHMAPLEKSKEYTEIISNFLKTAS